MIRILTHSTLSSIATVLALSSNIVLASDARAIALGGSIIANGKGVHGATANPASMMAMQRRSERIHVRIGMATEIRDSGSIIKTVTEPDNDDLFNDIEKEIDLLSETEIQCNPLLPDESQVCVTGTQPLADLSGRVLDIMDQLDEDNLSAFGSADFGVAFTNTKTPFAINLRASATGYGTSDIKDTDRAYISEFSTLLEGGDITLQEVNDSPFFSGTQLGEPLGVTQPEEVLESEGSGNALLRTQIGLSFATTMTIAQLEIDLGVTPKFSSLQAGSIALNAGDEFRDGTQSAADRFSDSEVTESSFTADIGGSMMLPNAPVQIAAVIRNLIPESIKAADGFEFETTPQLIMGAMYQHGMFSFNGDMALNEAKQDNFATQKIGVGIEYGTRLLSARAGISHDAARSNDSTALSLGVGLGAFSIGGRLAEVEGLEVGAQMAFSFL